MSIPGGRRFWKMSGSGNDFLFFDARTEAPGALSDPATIDRICARATGVGADGVVFIQDDANESFRIRYFNRDGSLGELCGNASLCTTRLARELGVAKGESFQFATDVGPIAARFVDGLPEIDLQPVEGLRPDAGIPVEPGEIRIGFANTGVPHLVVLVEDTESVDVMGRGRVLRHHPSLDAGANVNFVAKSGSGPWSMRTFERGVEGETLACGTGAVATAVMLEAWGLSGPETALETRSGRVLTVSIKHAGGAIKPSLRGEGRIVFVGELAEV
ncbi:MAG: diaminopimelate epimerase [Gemmatimonadetes bacterium]|nr:diaminopimelate epimerase [Gemmatimonadota bacterium]